MHFYRVCWIPSMGMSCFLGQNCTRFTKVSCFSVHFCSRLSPISCFACFLHVFVHLCGILCWCAAVCGRAFLSRVDILMPFYGVVWEPFMGMSCFLDETWMRIIKVSCFSVHFCSQLSRNPCFVCICLHILQIFVWFCVVRCSLWHAVPESSWSFNAIFRCFLRAVYGNFVFSRSKLHALHKSLVFFRLLLLPAVANLMFCVFFWMFLYNWVWFCGYVLQFAARSSWVELIF